MKLTTFLLLAAILQVSARTNAQTVTYTGKSVPLTAVFSAIKEQTGTLFFYRKEDLKDAGPVTLQLRNVPLHAALEQALAGQPLNFEIQGNTVFITLRPTPPPTPKGLLPEGSEEDLPPFVHGRVTDSLGNPLSGASVMIKGTKRGTTTDARGDFEFKGVAESVTLEISFTGYIIKEYKVRDYTNKFFVVMTRSNSPLDDVQVIAYGTASRRFSVGSIATVTADDIEKQPVSNILLALEGRVPGLLVTPSNGAPGASVATQIRGQNTIVSLPSAGNGIYDQPLFIVDGVPFAPQNGNLSSFLNSDFAGVGISALNGLNPANIESVSVLKDAEATSIYGSQGSNGVIVITTKKGKAGPTQLHLKVATGPNKITRNLDMYNTRQYLQMRRIAQSNDGLAGSTNTSDFPDLLLWDSTKYTNWAKKFFGGATNNTDVYGSVSGGVQNNTFILGAGYSRNTFNYPGNFADNRWTLHGGMHHNSQDHRLTIDFSNDLTYDRNNSSTSISMGSALTLAPNLPDLLDPQGNLVWSYKNVDISQWQMLSALKTPYLVQSFTLNNSLRLAYQVAKGLTVSTGLGYSLVYTKQYSASPKGAQNPALSSTGSADFGTGDYQTINIEPQVDYKKNIGRGILTALVGATYKENISSSNEQDGTGYTQDALLHTIQAATSVYNADNYSIVKYAGVFARLGYVYDREFILSLTGRRDGSSNFGPDHLFGNFGSAGLGWIFSEEKAFQKLLPFVSYAKIAGNYGSTGSDGVAPYQFQPFWRLANTFSYPLFEGIRAYQPVNLSNPNYGWASKAALNISLDLGFFHDRLLVNGTWYQDRTGNQLTSYPLPSQAGMSSVVENLNAVLQDKGWEISLSSTNIRTKNFRWSTTFNISANHNKLVKFPNIEKTSYASIYQVGKSTNLQYGFKYAGINDTTGVFQFYNAKGAKVYNGLKYSWASQGGDFVELGNTEPKFYGGLGNTFSYKGFSLTLFLHFSDALARNWLAGVYQGSIPGTLSNLPARLKMSDFWQKSGDQVSLERLTTGSYTTNPDAVLAQRGTNYFSNSSAIFGRNFYIRLQTISLAYTLPANTLKKVGVKNCSINMNAQNLFVITNYKFGDPETPGSFITVPLQRIITGGVSFDF
ncbi:MAG TPA: SusC/RagA family TonB-linked outer membrane protein [Puia sp.]|nr:SusC/RagA family TonB-linked outer membrane protein [Puia sp.]